MARTEGTFKIPANIEPQASAPLDARQIVPALADLTTAGTFPYPYEGMLVYVKSEQKFYAYKGGGTTNISNWLEIGSGGFSGDYDDLTNKPTLGTAAAKNVPSSGNASTAQVVMGNDSRLSDARTPTTHTHTKGQITDFPTSMPASDVYAWAKASSKPAYTANEVGLGNVPNVTTDNQTPTVTQATTRANLASGDTLKTIIGKIKKYFVDLHAVAFSGSYSDLSGKPTIPAAVAVKGNAETTYRTGDVNLTKANIGLGNVDNTSDSTKKSNFTGSIASGNTGFATGGDVYSGLAGKAPTNHASTGTSYGVGTSSNYGHVKLGAANQNGATAADGVAAPNGHTHSQYLTSHQDISGKAPNNHQSTGTTYGTGTTSAYGHVKLATGDMNGASNTDGVACSKNHTHSQYLTSHQDISGKAPNNHASSTTTYGVATSSNYGHVKLGAADQNGATAANGVAAPNGHTHSQYLTAFTILPSYVGLGNFVAAAVILTLGTSNGITGVSIVNVFGASTMTLTARSTGTVNSSGIGNTIGGLVLKSNYKCKWLGFSQSSTYIRICNTSGDIQTGGTCPFAENTQNEYVGVAVKFSNTSAGRFVFLLLGFYE